MSRYIRYKYQKQQINFMNCCDIDDWIDTNNKRISGFDSIDGDAPNKKNLELNDEWKEVFRFQDETYTCYEPILKEEVVNTIYRIRWRFNYSPTNEKFRFNIPLNSEDYYVIGVSDQDLSTYTIENRDSFEVDRVISGNSIDLQLRHTFSPVDEHFVDILYCKVNNNTEKGYLGIQTSYYGSSSCECVEVWENEPEVMTRTKKLNPNYEYECIDGNRHYRLQVQESYDKGASWVDTQRFELGDVYEENSEWCNATEIKFKWEYYNEIIKGFEKIINWIKKFSLDGGETWDYLTYIDDNGEVIYEYKQTAMNIDGCGRHSDIEYQISATDTYIGACSTSAVPIVKARYKTGKLCCIEQNIIWGDWGDWYRLDIDTDFTVDMPTIEKNETNREKIYEYTVQGIGVYGSLSATGRIIQEAGPCTPIPDVPDDPDEPTPEPEPENDFDGDIIYTFIEKNIAVDGRNKPTSIQIDGNWYYISTCRKYDGYADEYIAKEYLKNCISPQWTTIRWPRFSKHLVRLIKLPVQKELQKDNCYLYELISTFYECEIAEDLYLKDWDTSRVWNACSCFYNCKKLPKLDLSGWNTTSLSRAKEIFYGCSSLTEIDVSSWDISNLMTSAPTWYSKMFTGCSKLKTLYVKDNVAWWTERLKDCGVGGCKVIVK